MHMRKVERIRPTQYEVQSAWSFVRRLLIFLSSVAQSRNLWHSFFFLFQFASRLTFVLVALNGRSIEHWRQEAVRRRTSTGKFT